MRNRANRIQIARIGPDAKNPIGWIEIGFAVLMLLFLIALHLIVYRHSGGLWRDEVNSVNYVNSSSVFDFGTKFQSDSFPILWFLLLRAWVLLGFGGTDLALRGLGLIVGLGTLGALWHSGRKLGTRLPVLSLVLFTMTPFAFIGDSLRAYGLGVVLIVLALSSMWRVLQNPTPRRMVVCAFFVILSVQCLYSNAFLILAICLGAAVVCLYRRRWKLVAFPLGTGLLAAASILPYLWTFSAIYKAHIVTKVKISPLSFFTKFQEAINLSKGLPSWVWVVIALLTAVFMIRLLVKSRHPSSIREKELALYLLTTMVISFLTYYVFIKTLSWTPQSWYFLPLIAVLAVIMDRAIDDICNINPPGRIIRIACVMVIALLFLRTAEYSAYARRTNINALSAKLESLAGREDFIVLTRFYYGVSFARYYKGSAAWVTLPELADYSVHRYDLLKNKMMEKDPIDPVLSKIAQTLQGGHKVWLVGGINLFRAGGIPQELPPAPHPVYGWSEDAYEANWLDLTAYTLQTHGQLLTTIPIPVDTHTSDLENLPLMMVQTKTGGTAVQQRRAL
jgi:MFS family permease